MEKVWGTLVNFTVTTIDAFNSNEDQSEDFYGLVKLIEMNIDEKLPNSMLSVENVFDIVYYWHDYLANKGISSFDDLLNILEYEENGKKILGVYDQLMQRQEDIESIEGYVMVKLVEAKLPYITMKLLSY